MTNERFWQLQNSATLPLTKEELKDGWHFCPDWDGMLKQFDETCPCEKWTDEEIAEIPE